MIRRAAGLAMKLRVLYLDNHLLVLFKPAGMLAQADETGDPDILSAGKDYLKRRFAKPGNVYLGLVHRLDRPASGIMVLARSSKAAARLTGQFRFRQVHKKYLAIVAGALVGEGQWHDHLFKDGRNTKVVPAGHPHGKEASLSWKCLGNWQGFSLAEIELHTGRPHQIRVQFASRGHPLLGDFRYGSDRQLDGVSLALHGYRLGLSHPIRQVPMAWWVMPPKSWDGWFRPELAALEEALERECGQPDEQE